MTTTVNSRQRPPSPPLPSTAAINRHQSCRQQCPSPPPPSTEDVITTTTPSQWCSKDAITTTTIYHHCHLTAVGSIPPLPPMTTTATLALIALAIALPQRRIKPQGGGPAVARAIHHRRGCCCWCRLCCLCSGNRRDRHANICGQEEVGHHNPIAPVPVDSYHQSCSTLTPPHIHVVHIVLNLIVVSFGGGGGG